MDPCQGARTVSLGQLLTCLCLCFKWLSGPDWGIPSHLKASVKVASATLGVVQRL